MKNLFKKETIIGPNYKSVWFEDKNIRVEDNTEKGVREVTYSIFKQAGEKEPVIHKMNNDKEIDMVTLNYFSYISNGNLPAFKRVREGEKFKCNFKCIDGKTFEFQLTFPIEVTVLELGNTILVFYGHKENNNPFEFKQNLFNEINFVNDRFILMTDYRNKEVYILNDNYATVITGKIDDFGNIKEYIHKLHNDRFIYKYTEDHIIDTVQKVQSYDNIIQDPLISYFYNIITETCNYKYAVVPYAKTSYGAEVSTNRNEIIMYSYEKTVEDEDTITINEFYDLITCAEFNTLVKF